jgi:hypothetical protein
MNPEKIEIDNYLISDEEIEELHTDNPELKYPTDGISFSRATGFMQKIPWGWQVTALRLKKPSAVAVGIVLWHEAGLKRTDTVKLSRRLYEEVGLSRNGYNTGLKLLEMAGLVTVERRHGKSPVVTLRVSGWRGYKYPGHRQ